MAGAKDSSGRRGKPLAGAHRAHRPANGRGRAPLLSADSFPGALLFVDRGGMISDANAAASKLSGWTRSGSQGRALGDLLTPRAANRSAVSPKSGIRPVAKLKVTAAPRPAWLARPKGKPLAVMVRRLRASNRGKKLNAILIEAIASPPASTYSKASLVELLLHSQPFSAVFDGSNVAVALADGDGRLLRSNAALSKLTGYSRTQLQRTSLDALTHPEDQTLSQTAASLRSARVSEKHRDKRLIRKSGDLVWVRVSLTPLAHKVGGKRYFLTGLQDISALKSATENLRESEERFRSAFDASAIGMGLVSPAGRYLRVNRALCEFFGLEPEAMIGRDIAEFNEPDEYATIVQRRQQMIDGSIPRYFSYEKRFLHKSGRSLWGQLTVALVRDLNDRPSYFVILIQDTTERHNAELTLRDSEQRLRALIESLPVLMDAFDEHGMVIAWNMECERVTGYTAKEMIGNPLALEWLYPDPDYRAAMLEDAFKHNKHAYRNHAWDLRAKDGQIRTVAWSNVGAELQIPGWKEWGIGIDITERRRLELALQQASEYEQRRLGQEMHDGLGQELAALALLAYSLASKPDLVDEPLRQELDRLAQISRQAVRSGRAIAHGLAPLHESEGDLIEALRRMTQHHLAEVSGTQVVLEEQLSAELAIPATARSHLYRIAQEALNNAIRHAKAKSVRMELHVTPRLVRLSIGDDGKGFTPRSERSAGMGLKTMQNRAAAIGASLSLRTDSQEGTHITVECLNLSAPTGNTADEAAERAGVASSGSSTLVR